MLNRKIITIALFCALALVVVGLVVLSHHVGLAEPIMPPIGPP
ncbi:MAG TPA: hypothetical protein VKQ72_15320 [Aggregatilineales bacterium]|nr:hypothetical protein [Aggregatilineales bacterium]